MACKCPSAGKRAKVDRLARARIKLSMLDLGPYFRRPIFTLAAVTADPIESWVRFREQYAAHREGATPSNLYNPDKDWEGFVFIL